MHTKNHIHLFVYTLFSNLEHEYMSSVVEWWQSDNNNGEHNRADECGKSGDGAIASKQTTTDSFYGATKNDEIWDNKKIAKSRRQEVRKNHQKHKYTWDGNGGHLPANEEVAR